jgi:phosphoribosyl-ATP pyrophosphohydrolase
MARETQASICEWASATFDDPGSNYRVAVRAQEEMVEGLRAETIGKSSENIAEEIADTAIVMLRLMQRLGVEIDETDGSDGGYVPSVSRNLAFANRVLASIIEDLSDRDYIPAVTAATLLGRIWGRLHGCCDELGVPLWDAIQAKMAINRKRRWVLDGTGHGYHVRKAPGVA